MAMFSDLSNGVDNLSGLFHVSNKKMGLKLLVFNVITA